jgi:hypothetical protein
MLLKSLLLTGGILASVNLAWAQNDHLVPAKSYFFSYNHEEEYYPKLRKTLYEGLATAPLARVTVLPGLTTEYLLTLEQEKQQMYLLYRTCKPSVWSTMPFNHPALQPQPTTQPTVETRKVAVSLELAAAVATLFNTAIAQTKYPEPEMAQYSDGTTFVFSSFRHGIGLQGGQTWSPRAGTHMASLVAIVDQLQQLALAPEAERQLLAAALIAHATTLANQLKAR